MPVSASGDNEVRSSIATRISSSQSRSSGAKVMSPSSSASSVSNVLLVAKHFVELLGLSEKARLHARQTIAHRKRALIQLRNCERCVAFFRVFQHVTAIRSEQQFEQVAGETTSRLDDREETLRREIETTQHARHVQNDFAHEPVIVIRRKRLIDCQDVFSIAFGAQTDETDQRFVDAQVQQRIVELAISLQRPVSSRRVPESARLSLAADLRAREQSDPRNADRDLV